MILQKITAGFHFAHTYVPTLIMVPVCDSCEHVDVNSQEFKDAFRQAQLRFQKEHPHLVRRKRDEDKRDEDLEEILHRAAEEAEEADPDPGGGGSSA